MIYTVPCKCGKRIKATASQAGMTIACECGEQHNIPLLSELRKLLGQGAYATSTADDINRMIREGELPWVRYVRFLKY